MANKRTTRRIDRINKAISIIDLLVDYGYHVHSGGDREEQFPCDLHGDGMDGKPSARVYPDSSSWYCFACGTSRDVIQTVREKEGMGFLDALKHLEKKLNLPPLPFEDGDYESPATLGDQVTADANREGGPRVHTFEGAQTRLKTLLDRHTDDRELPLQVITTFWEGFDRVCFEVRDKQRTEGDGIVLMSALWKRLRKRILEPSTVHPQ